MPPIEPLTSEAIVQLEKKRAQARLNGAKSKGPTSEEGKRKSSRNAILHGLNANENALLETESPAQYAEIRQAFIQALRPADKAELRFVEQIANLDWRNERLTMMETALLNRTADTTADQIRTRFERIDGIGIIVESWRQTKSASECFSLIQRYQGGLARQIRSALANFRDLERARLARTQDGVQFEEPPYVEPQFDTHVRPAFENPQPPHDEQYGGLPNEPTEPNQDPEPVGESQKEPMPSVIDCRAKRQGPGPQAVPKRPAA